MKLINKINIVQRVISLLLGRSRQVKENANLRELLDSVDECLVIMKEVITIDIVE